jgi:hypothetical protein
MSLRDTQSRVRVRVCTSIVIDGWTTMEGEREDVSDNDGVLVVGLGREGTTKE